MIFHLKDGVVLPNHFKKLISFFLFITSAAVFGATLESINLFHKTSCFVYESEGGREFKCFGARANLELPLKLEKGTLVSGSKNFICAANSTTLACAGSNLNFSNEISDIQKLALAGSNICYSKSGVFDCLGNGVLSKTKLPKVSSVVDFSTSENHGCLIDQLNEKEKKILCFGNNKFGKADPPPFTGKPVQVVAGKNYSCALIKKEYSQEILCWGKKSFDPSQIDSPIFIKGGKHFVCAVQRVDFTKRKLTCFGDSLPENIPDLNTISALEVGSYTGCAYDLEFSELICFGNNTSGQLDIDMEVLSAIPVKEIQIKEDEIKPDRVVSRKYGEAHSCTLFESGRVKCWGLNNNGQLGYGDTNSRGDGPSEMGQNLPFVDLGGEKVLSIALGKFHSCALLISNRIKCWGKNSNGQLGHGSVKARGAAPGEMGANLSYLKLGDEKIIGISAGENHNCAVFESRRIKCWGYNGYGQLGYGNTLPIGKISGEMGNNLKYVDLGSHKVVSVDLGLGHSCAIFENGKVKCWGWNSSGQLGLGDKSNRGDQTGEMGDNLDFLDFGPEKLIQMSIGGSTNCALFESSRVKCWGWNYWGACGYGDTDSRGDRPGEMGAALEFVDLGGEKVRSIVSRGSSCAVLESGRVKCWGYNTRGELGSGNRLHIGKKPNEMGVNLKYLDLDGGKIRSISQGKMHACAIFTSGKIKCWGENLHGQLGLGDKKSRGTATGEMGSNLQFVDLGNEKIIQ